MNYEKIENKIVCVIDSYGEETFGLVEYINTDSKWESIIIKVDDNDWIELLTSEIESIEVVDTNIWKDYDDIKRVKCYAINMLDNTICDVVSVCIANRNDKYLLFVKGKNGRYKPLGSKEYEYIAPLFISSITHNNLAFFVFKENNKYGILRIEMVEYGEFAYTIVVMPEFDLIAKFDCFDDWNSLFQLLRYNADGVEKFYYNGKTNSISKSYQDIQKMDVLLFCCENNGETEVVNSLTDECVYCAKDSNFSLLGRMGNTVVLDENYVVDKGMKDYNRMIFFDTKTGVLKISNNYYAKKIQLSSIKVKEFCEDISFVDIVYDTETKFWQGECSGAGKCISSTDSQSLINELPTNIAKI